MARVIAEKFDAERVTGVYIQKKMRHLGAPPQEPFGHRFDRHNGPRYVRRERQVFVVCETKAACLDQPHPCITTRVFLAPEYEIGRASCRERVCQYVSISVVAVSLKKKRSIYKSSH